MQELNQSIVLDTIRKIGPISRSEIAKRTKLSPTTVTSAVNELIRSGYVTEGGQGESSGGRKPIQINFLPDSKVIIGVSVTNSTVLIACMNLNAEPRGKKLYYLNSHGKMDVVTQLLNFIGDYIDHVKDIASCIGISIIAPGIINSTDGIILLNSKLQLMDIPLKKMVEERFGLKVWLNNDANAIALAESTYGSFRDKKNLIYIQLGEGLGSGIVVNKKVFVGNHGGAGEFGHISINRGGRVCECGNAGCLENFVGWPALYSTIVAAIAKGNKTLIRDLCGEDVSQITEKTFITALKMGDSFSKQIAVEAAKNLALGLVTMVNLFDPEVILIGWNTLKADNELIEMIREVVMDNALKIFTRELMIQTTTLGDDFQLIGTAVVPINKLFELNLLENH